MFESYFLTEMLVRLYIFLFNWPASPFGSGGKRTNVYISDCCLSFFLVCVFVKNENCMRLKSREKLVDGNVKERIRFPYYLRHTEHYTFILNITWSSELNYTHSYKHTTQFFTLNTWSDSFLLVSRFCITIISREMEAADNFYVSM